MRGKGIAEEQPEHDEPGEPGHGAHGDCGHTVLVQGLHIHPLTVLLPWSAHGSEHGDHDEQSEQDGQGDQAAGTWVHGQGAPEVSKLPSFSTDDGMGLPDCDCPCEAVTLAVGEGLTVRVAVALAVALGVVGTTEADRVGPVGVVVAGVAGGAVVLGTRDDVALALGVTVSSPESPRSLLDAHRAPAPRPSPIATRTATTSGQRDALGCSSGGGGEDICMVGWSLTVARSCRSGQRFPTTQSMLAVNARTSSLSMAGNIATRSWLRPSLR